MKYHAATMVMKLSALLRVFDTAFIASFYHMGFTLARDGASFYICKESYSEAYHSYIVSYEESAQSYLEYSNEL